MNFILGGRMGDLIHMLYVVKNTPGKHDLFITDRRDLHSDGFIYPLDKTVQELLPVLMQQDYVNSVKAYDNEPDCINLNMWRAYAYAASWANLLSWKFNVPVTSGAWLSESGKSYSYRNETIIHCSIPDARRGDWSKVDIIDGVFMGSIEEYNNFGKFHLTHVMPKTLRERFVLINSCKLFIGNQSSPLAIAHALDVPRIAVLNEVDKFSYIGEELIYPNFKYVL